MEVLRLVLGSALLLFGLFIVITNYVRQIANTRNRTNEGRWSSPVPFFGPLFIIAGYWVFPIEFSNWVFLAVVLDPDTVLTTIGLPHFIKSLRD